MCKIALSEVFLDRIDKVYRLIKQRLPQSEVYLFGSYAKKKIRPESDIDMLVLIQDDLDKMSIKKIKWELEETIEEATADEYEVDLKIYTREHFERSKQVLGFESAISEYMVSLEGCKWR